MDGQSKAAPAAVSSASILLRVGLAFAFSYAAIASFREPDAWIGYFPVFLRHTFPAAALLTGFSLVELGLSLWLLSGKKLLYSASLSAIMLAGIVIINFGAMDIVFRDVGLLFAALALAVLGRLSDSQSG